MLFRLFSKKVFFPQLSSFHPEFSLDCMAILIFSFMHLKILLASTHFQSHFHTFRYLLPQHPTSQYQFPSYYAWASIIKYDKWLKISHGSGAKSSKIKVPADLVPGVDSLHGLQMATFFTWWKK